MTCTSEQLKTKLKVMQDFVRPPLKQGLQILKLQNCNYLDLKGDLSDSKIKNEKLEEFLFDLSVNNGIVEGYVKGNGKFGEILLYPVIRNLKDNPVYRADITAKNLDLAIITGNYSFNAYSDINLILKFSEIGEFAPYIPSELKNLKTGGTVNAHLTGNTDSLFITVDITETSESPSVNFKLDGSSITEGDALSYILFGKSMNELTLEEQNNLGGMDTGELAGKAASSILSSQITDFMGDRLNVDYIEVKGGENFEKATLSVGKYITNDLFISYEQRFGEIDEKDLATYEVELEYELFKFLFFVLNNSSKHSGFDVIFKFTRK